MSAYSQGLGACIRHKERDRPWLLIPRTFEEAEDGNKTTVYRLPYRD